MNGKSRHRNRHREEHSSAERCFGREYVKSALMSFLPEYSRAGRVQHRYLFLAGHLCAKQSGTAEPSPLIYQG